MLLVLCVSALGAEYQGKNIDGKRYEAEIKAPKAIHSGKVEFQGNRATLYFDGKGVEVKLESESIENPNKVYAWNEEGSWVISFTPG